MSEQDRRAALLELTANIVSAYVGNNAVARSDLAGLIADTFGALQSRQGGAAAEAEPEPLKPAVPIKKSVQDDHIVCLEDGKKFKSLKRHLSTAYNLTPDEYRAKWKLPADYPMVAPAYAAARSALARTLGLGRKPQAKAPEPAKKPARRAARTKA